LGKVLEEDHSFSAEASSNKDENSPRLQSLTRFGGLDGFPNLMSGRLESFLMAKIQEL
jgi:hypothetical protein